MFRGFGWRSFGGAAAVIILLTVSLAVLFAHRREAERMAELRGMYAPLAAAVARTPDTAEIEKKLAAAALLGVNAAWLAPNGEALATYPLTPDARTELRSFPEVRSALTGREAAAFRFSGLLKRDAWFVALPSGPGVLHVVADPSVLEAADTEGFYLTLMGVSAAALGLAGVLAFFLHASIAARISALSLRLEEVRGRFFSPGETEQAVDPIERAGAQARSIAGGVAETMGMLADEKEKVSAIIQQMEDGVVLLSGETRILLANNAFISMFGLNAGAVHGARLGELVRNPALLDLAAFFFRNGAGAKREIALGGPPARHVLASIAPLAAAQPRSRALLMLYDITQQKKLEEMRVDFVANASHELKTPLTAIRGFIETLNDGEAHGPDETRHFLGIIERQAERLGRLIDDLLALSDIELGKEKLDFAPLSPASVIKAAEQVVSQSAQQRNVALSHEVEEGAGPVEADRDRLMQILLNLLDNAIKYTPPGGRVETHCRKIVVQPDNAAAFGYSSLDGNPLLPRAEGEWRREFVEFTVADTGEGIPAASLPRLMERFYRVDKARSRERGGTGLGLSIVKHIVIAHGGSIRIESEMGKGTSVRVIIPQSRPPA